MRAGWLRLMWIDVFTAMEMVRGGGGGGGTLDGCTLDGSLNEV